MKSLQSILSEAYENSQTSFVFPSEVAAGFWKKKLLKESTINAVRADRFLSWDSFKERITERDKEKKPANRLIRLLFADEICRKNAQSPLFTAFIPESFHAQSAIFTEYIASILPQLYCDYLPVHDHPKFSRTEPGLLKDLKTLESAYSQFLAERRLFEPSSVKPVIRPWEGRVLLLFPQVLEDYSQFAPYLHCSAIQIIGPELTEPSPESSPVLRLFSDSLMEARWVCRTIADMLDDKAESSLRMDEIALTTPSKGALNMVKEEARLYGLPLSLQMGEALSAYPAGRFFRLLSLCRGSGYAYENLKNLLLNRAFPWKNIGINRNLIRFGREYYCLKGVEENGVLEDVWEYNLKRTGNIELLPFYRQFVSVVGSIVKAGSFGVIKQRLALFTSLFFDINAWDRAHKAVFERCLTLCDSLEEAASAMGGDIQNPYSLFLLALDKQTYVHQSGSGGIPVYPYRVSAGIYPKLHMVFGLSSKETQVRIKVFPYLRSDYKSLAEVEDMDLTAPFGTLYTQSGETVFSSGSRETPSGTALPPGIFLDGLDHQKESESALAREREYWARRTPNLEERIFTAQKQGLAWYGETGWREEKPNLANTPCENTRLTREIASVLTTEEGYFRISPSSLEDYNACPFSFLFLRVFYLEEEGGEFAFSDSLTIGNMYHLAMKEAYDTLQASSRQVGTLSPEACVSLAEDCVEAVFEEWEEKDAVFIGPVWRDLKERMAASIGACLVSDAKTFEDWNVFATEFKQEWKDENKKILYKGKIDRVLEKDSMYHLTDYKKSLSMKKRHLLPSEAAHPAEAAPPLSSQIPFYILLMEQTGHPVEGAAYYGFSEEKLTDVFSSDPLKKPWFSKDVMDSLTAGVTEDAERMMKGIWEGRYAAAPSETSCRFCPLSGLCRTKFNIR